MVQRASEHMLKLEYKILIKVGVGRTVIHINDKAIEAV